MIVLTMFLHVYVYVTIEEEAFINGMPREIRSLNEKIKGIRTKAELSLE